MDRDDVLYPKETLLASYQLVSPFLPAAHGRGPGLAMEHYDEITLLDQP